MQDKDVTFLSRTLAALISERKITKASLAREIGVSHVAVGNWIKGQTPNGDQLHALAQYFGVSMEWLLTGEDKVGVASPNTEWQERALLAERHLMEMKAGMKALLKKI